MMSMTKIARKLVFYTYPFDLMRDTTLMLSFMPPKTEKLYIDMCEFFFFSGAAADSAVSLNNSLPWAVPIAWRVSGSSGA
jgi:hypothetical protein